MKEKIINSIAIIFLAFSCIFNSFKIYDLRTKISSLENNKIVETKGVKRAFENAPLKTNDLPGINQEFKIYFNISTLNEFKTFFNYLDNYSDTSSDNLIFCGTKKDTNNLLMFGFSDSGQYIDFTISYVENYEIFTTFSYTFNIDNESITFVWVNGQESQNLDQETLVEQANYLNDNLFNSFYYSNSSLSFGDMEQPVINILSDQNYIYGYDGEQKTIPGALLGTITIIATGILNILISLFNNVLPIFWVNNAPTFIGTIVLFAVAIPITYWVINFILGLIRKIRLTRGQ